MSAFEQSLTLEYVKSILSYDPDTGKFTRLKTEKRNLKFRKDADIGKKPGDYKQVSIGDGVVRSHRLAWFYSYGVWPRSCIDHINCDKSDNRIVNLREATRGQNIKNSGARRNNRLGVKGVSKNGNRFHVNICSNGEKFLWIFDSLEEAAECYAVNSRKLHGEFARAA